MKVECLAVYDIADPKRLRRIARILERYGVRVQRSVFECSLTASTMRELRQALLRVMAPSQDSFRIYPLPGNSRMKQVILGVGEPADFPACYIV